MDRAKSFQNDVVPEPTRRAQLLEMEANAPSLVFLIAVEMYNAFETIDKSAAVHGWCDVCQLIHARGMWVCGAVWGGAHARFLPRHDDSLYLSLKADVTRATVYRSSSTVSVGEIPFCILK